ASRVAPLITNQLLYQLSYAGKKKLKRYRRYNVKTDGPESHLTFCTPGRFLEVILRLFADTRVGGKRSGRFQILDDGAEIDRLGIERFIFCDLGPIQNLEAIALEHFLTAPALEGDDLAANAFFTGAVKIT